MRLIFGLISVVVLAGCAAPAVITPFSNSKLVRGSYEQVWDGVIDTMASQSMSIKVLAKDSGIVTSESVRFGKEFARCDDTMLHNTRRLATFNVRVQRGDLEQRVTVNSHFRVIGRNTITGSVEEHDCASTGTLENMLLPGGAYQGQAQAVVTSGVQSASVYAALEDVAKVPTGPDCQATYRGFLTTPIPRAYVVGAPRANGYRLCIARSGQNAHARAMADCQSNANNLGKCSYYAVDQQVVWRGD